MPANPADLRRALITAAKDQGGYFTAQQAMAAGYSHQAQAYHVSTSNWVRVGRGTFRLPDWPTSPNDPYIEVQLWSGSRGVLSHESALTIHDLGDVNPASIHLTVPKGFRAQRDDVTLHKATLSPHDIQDLGDIRVTTALRTLLDVAAGDNSQEQLETTVADALSSGLVTRRMLLENAEHHGYRAALRIERTLSWGQSNDEGSQPPPHRSSTEGQPR